ncbi:MAG: hypothetical protein ACK452_00890 [Bacteroidota bacterium]|jgi:hypothetical protein
MTTPQKIITTFLSIIFLIVCSSAVSQEKKSIKGLKREILFTLRPSEIIYTCEYVSDFKMTATNFSAITVDTNTNTGSFIFNGKRVIDWVDQEYRPIEIYYLNHKESNGYVFGYRRNGQEYINIKGKNRGPFYSVKASTTASAGKTIFVYREKEHSPNYVDVDGKIFGPYEFDYSYDLDIWEDGRFCVCFMNTGIINEYYSILNGNQINENSVCSTCNMERENLRNTVIDERYWYEYDYEFLYQKGQKKLYSSDGLHFFSSFYDKPNVIIDGVPYGKSPALEAGYSEAQNAFIWLSMEGNNLIRYSYSF